MATLYVFGGLPGAGKTTLAKRLSLARGAVLVRVDTIEQALREEGISIHAGEGYRVGYEIAADNLRLGSDVVADSVNPLEITRAAWREAASRCGAGCMEIEVVCSDAREHRARVEARATDVPGLRLPTWSDVERREYEPWEPWPLTIDTCGRTPEESFAELSTLIDRTSAAG